MTNKFFELVKWELLIAHQINNIIRYLLCFFLLCNFSLLLISSQEQIKIFGMIFVVISLPLAMLAFANLLFKPDCCDGSLELLLIDFTPLQITCAKYLSLSVCAAIGCLINLPVLIVFFGVNIWQALQLMCGLLLFLPLITILIILTGAMQCYFQNETNHLSLVIMPLLIPSIVVAGLLLTNTENQYFNCILLGIDLLIIPSAVYSTSYLVKNIYHI